MAGDVNLFLNHQDVKTTAEIEVCQGILLFNSPICGSVIVAAG